MLMPFGLTASAVDVGIYLKNFLSRASFSGARALTIADEETKNNIRIILHSL